MLRQLLRSTSTALRSAVELSGPSSASTSYTTRSFATSARAFEEKSDSGSKPAPASSETLDSILSSVSMPGLSSEPTPQIQPQQDMPRVTPRTRASSDHDSFSRSGPAHRLHIQTTRNNTILTFTTPEGEPIASASGGSVGFKKAARSGYEAGYRAAFDLFGKITENKDKWRIQQIEVFWNGFGQGREAVYRALLTSEAAVTRALVKKMTDKTPLKIGGVRPKKRRSKFLPLSHYIPCHSLTISLFTSFLCNSVL